LLEALATAIADDLLQRFDAERVVVRVTKPDVRPGGLEGTAGVSVSKP
jgi:dihydroneopterin aldolase